ncbi:outer membrane lipoprotein carrier protein LolA [Acidobacteria bacterium AH-259-D05]|nr:outer membrane lipoprotein carrier protein LolA [Acidobacteria bacterium AH-259-D05]
MKSRKPMLFVYLALFAFIDSTAPGMVPEFLTLEQILTKMDQRGSTLRSMSSSIYQKKWTDILEEFDQGESGRFDFLREEDKIYLRKDIVKPQRNTLVIRDGKVFFYQPRIKQLQRYDLGKRRDRAEFLLLGFSSNKKALKEAYDIRLGEKETIEGHETYRLELTPKSKTVSAYFTRIVLWIDTELWVPIQQKLVEPTRDYLLFRFDDIHLNPKTPKSKFDLKVPDDVEVVGN